MMNRAVEKISQVTLSVIPHLMLANPGKETRLPGGKLGLKPEAVPSDI
jgi:hypothetical protein